MRQGKLSELIHNSEQAPDLGYCKVEVWFKEIIDLVSSRRVQEQKIQDADPLLM